MVKKKTVQGEQFTNTLPITNIKRKGKWIPFFAALPALAVSTLPFLSCPLCWPLYASLLGSAGLSFFNYTPYLMPVVGFSLLVALVSIGYQVKKNSSSYWPFVLAVIASLAIFVGKFVLISNAILYTGVVGLIVAVIWNARSVKLANNGDCSCCTKEKSL